MSVEAFSWALKVPVGGTAKVVLLGIANHATAEMTEARPSIETLAKYANCDRRTVQRKLRQLEADGWIVRTGRHALSGRPDRAVGVYSLTGRQIVAPHGAASQHGAAPVVERGGISDQNGAAPEPPEPSIGTVLEPSSSSAAADARERDDVITLCDYLANAIVANDQRAKPKRDSAGWRDAARLLLDSDERPYDEVVRVIRWCQSDQFWKSNVLSMPKLREKYPSLLLKMQGDSPQQQLAETPAEFAKYDRAGRRPEAA